MSRGEHLEIYGWTADVKQAVKRSRVLSQSPHTDGWTDYKEELTSLIKQTNKKIYDHRLNNLPYRSFSVENIVSVYGLAPFSNNLPTK